MRQARSNFDRNRRSEPSPSFILISCLCGLRAEVPLLLAFLFVAKSLDKQELFRQARVV